MEQAIGHENKTPHDCNPHDCKHPEKSFTNPKVSDVVWDGGANAMRFF